jgi:hypothetical protein
MCKGVIKTAILDWQSQVWLTLFLMFPYKYYNHKIILVVPNLLKFQRFLSICSIRCYLAQGEGGIGSKEKLPLGFDQNIFKKKKMYCIWGVSKTISK